MDNMEDSNSSIYVQAKIEYTKQLINNIQSHIFDGVNQYMMILKIYIIKIHHHHNYLYLEHY